jgi:excisionase family DNA binding protein
MDAPMQGEGNEMLLTVEQVAERLGVSPRTVARLENDPHFPRRVKLGKAVRWPASAVARWIRSDCPLTNAEA